VERDELMTRLARDYPPYQWQDNKGYASVSHIAALGEFGACAQHRRSWKLPGL
ncbi:MAG: ribonuclease HII, partial [Actinomycetota bacterium]|nr:ribonuclease HII [Actinomycetota bacterium]